MVARKPRASPKGMYGFAIRYIGSGGSGNNGKSFVEDVRLIPAPRIDAS